MSSGPGSNMDKKTSNPEKYGMVTCPRCYGRGFIEYDVGRNVCSKCGGFGWIRKVEVSKKNAAVDREVS